MSEHMIGLVRSLFAALRRKDHSRVESILAEAEAAGLLQQLLTSELDDAPPLHAAVVMRDSHMVNILLASGAPVDAAATVAEAGATALHFAAGLDQAGIVRLLLDAGADIGATASLKDGVELRVLQFACTTGSREVVRELIAAGAALQQTDHALTCTLCAAVQLGRPDILEEVLQALQLSARILNDVATAAIGLGRWDMLQQLLHAGASEGGAVLCAVAHASLGGSLESSKALGVLQDLLAAGAPVDTTDQDGRTVLQIAAQVGSAETVRVLLAAGAATNVRSSRGRTALHAACASTATGCGTGAQDSHSSELVGMLLAAGAPAGLAAYREDQQLGVQTPLEAAADVGDAAVLRQLCTPLQLSAEGPDAAGELAAMHWSAMRYAIVHGHVGVMQELFAAGSDVLHHTPAAGHLGEPEPEPAATALKMAAVKVRPAVIDCMIQHCSPQQLTATVLVDAAAAIPAAVLLPPEDWAHPGGTSAEMEREAVLLLLRAAVERSDPQSIFAALQPAVDPSNAQPAAAEFGSLREAIAHCRPKLLRQFAQLMCSRYSQLEDQHSTAQWAVHCMCVDVVLQCMAESGSQGPAAYAARDGEVDAAAVMPTCDKTATQG